MSLFSWPSRQLDKLESVCRAGRKVSKGKDQKTTMKLLILFAIFHAPVIELPKEISGQPNSFITVPAKTDGAVVKWLTPDVGLNIFPVDLLKDTKTLVVTGPEGRFRVYAYTSDATGPSNAAMCMVMIGAAPEPTPVNPVDPEEKNSEITEAAKKEEKEAVQWLNQFYLELAKESQKEDYKTVGDVFRAAKVAINKQFKPDELSNLRAVIGKRLNAKLPQDPEKNLDKPTRDLMSQVFMQVAKELK